MRKVWEGFFFNRAAYHARQRRFMKSKAVLTRGLGIATLLLLFWKVLASGFSAAPSGMILDTLDWANLSFHEAGHFILPIFGEFIDALGGSLMQIAIPVICTVHFLRHRQRAASSVALFWTGESITQVGVYVADAQRMKLPLIGEIHDWNYILGSLNRLDQAEFLGQWVFLAGAATMFCAILVLILDFIRCWRHALT